MMSDRVLQSPECAVMEEGRLHGSVAQRRRSKAVAVGGIAGDLLHAEVLVASRPVEDHVAFSDPESRSNLRDPDDVVFEIAEHLVRRSTYGVALDAFRLPEKDQGA